MEQLAPGPAMAAASRRGDAVDEKLVEALMRAVRPSDWEEALPAHLVGRIAKELLGNVSNESESTTVTPSEPGEVEHNAIVAELEERLAQLLQLANMVAAGCGRISAADVGGGAGNECANNLTHISRSVTSWRTSADATESGPPSLPAILAYPVVAGGAIFAELVLAYASALDHSNWRNAHGREHGRDDDDDDDDALDSHSERCQDTMLVLDRSYPADEDALRWKLPEAMGRIKSGLVAAPLEPWCESAMEKCADVARAAQSAWQEAEVSVSRLEDRNHRGREVRLAALHTKVGTVSGVVAKKPRLLSQVGPPRAQDAAAASDAAAKLGAAIMTTDPNGGLDGDTVWGLGREDIKLGKGRVWVQTSRPAPPAAAGREWLPLEHSQGRVVLRFVMCTWTRQTAQGRQRLLLGQGSDGGVAKRRMLELFGRAVSGVDLPAGDDGATVYERWMDYLQATAARTPAGRAQVGQGTTRPSADPLWWQALTSLSRAKEETVRGNGPSGAAHHVAGAGDEHHSTLWHGAAGTGAGDSMDGLRLIAGMAQAGRPSGVAPTCEYGIDAIEARWARREDRHLMYVAAAKCNIAGAIVVFVDSAGEAWALQHQAESNGVYSTTWTSGAFSGRTTASTRTASPRYRLVVVHCGGQEGGGVRQLVSAPTLRLRGGASDDRIELAVVDFGNRGAEYDALRTLLAAHKIRFVVAPQDIPPKAAIGKRPTDHIDGSPAGKRLRSRAGGPMIQTTPNSTSSGPSTHRPGGSSTGQGPRTTTPASLRQPTAPSPSYASGGSRAASASDVLGEEESILGPFSHLIRLIDEGKTCAACTAGNLGYDDRPVGVVGPCDDHMWLDGEGFYSTGQAKEGIKFASGTCYGCWLWQAQGRRSDNPGCHVPLGQHARQGAGNRERAVKHLAVAMAVLRRREFGLGVEWLSGGSVAFLGKDDNISLEAPDTAHIWGDRVQGGMGDRRDCREWLGQARVIGRCHVSHLCCVLICLLYPGFKQDIGDASVFGRPG